MYRAKERIWFLLVATWLAAFTAHAKVGGKITGTVKDQSGSAIPLATVELTNTTSPTNTTWKIRIHPVLAAPTFRILMVAHSMPHPAASTSSSWSATRNPSVQRS